MPNWLKALYWGQTKGKTGNSMTQSIFDQQGEDHFTPPTQELLEMKALHFLKTCRREAYREVKGAGELAEWVTLKANAARKYAENMISNGAMAEEAWNMAVRLEILGSETD